MRWLQGGICDGILLVWMSSCEGKIEWRKLKIVLLRR